MIDAIAERKHLILATLVVVVAGVAWLVIEAILRHLEFDPGVVLPLLVFSFLLAGSGAFVGLAIRPRISWRGELLVNGELVGAALMAVFVPAAVMLVVYGLTVLASWVFALLCWVVWILVMVLATIFQALVLAACLRPVVLAGGAGVYIADEQGEPAAGCGACGCILVILGGAVGAGIFWVSGVFGLGPWELITGAVWTAALEWRDWIKGWFWLFGVLHDLIQWLDYGKLLGLFAATALGVILGCGVALAVRWLRQLAMIYVPLRPYLPSASAPLPDGTTTIRGEMVWPAVFWASVAWIGVLVLVIPLWMVR